MLNNINISGCASFLETGSTFNCIKACFWVSVKKVNGKRLIDFISLGACNFWMTDKKGGLLVILFHCKLDTTLLSRRSSSFDFTHKDKKNYLIGYILEIKIKSKNILFQSHVQFSLVWRDNVIIYIGYIIPVHQFLRIAARNTDCRPTKQPIEKQIFYLSVSGLFVSNKRKIAVFCVINNHANS